MNSARRWRAAIVLSSFLLAGCPGDSDNQNVAQSAESVLDKMPDADLSTLQNVNQALAALGDQGGFGTILNTEEASFGQNEMMEMALLGLEFTDELAEEQTAPEKDFETEAEKTPAENCKDLQDALAKRGFTCPMVECSASGSTFKNVIKGDCEGRDRRGDRFSIRGEFAMEGTFDGGAGNIDARVAYKGFEIVYDRGLSPEGLPPEAAKSGPKSITIQSSIAAGGEVEWKTRGFTKGSLDFTGEVSSRLRVGLGTKFDVDGKTGGGDITLNVSTAQKVISKPEMFTFESSYVQECEGRSAEGTLLTGAVGNQQSGSVARNDAVLTLNASGRQGDSGMETCLESPSKGLQQLMEEAYGMNSARGMKVRAAGIPRLLRLRRSHMESDEEADLNGKFSFKADGVLAHSESCKREPMSGALTLTAGSQAAEVAFDGVIKCDGSTGVKINGKDVGRVQSGDFLPVGGGAH